MWRLGLDLGTNSIGWAVLELNDNGDGTHGGVYGILDMGVRIFPDGREPASKHKTGLPRIGDSLAVTRRKARGMRRNRDRRLKRIRQFGDKLVEFGLIPAKGVAGRQKYKTGVLDMSLDPYAARSECASKTTTPARLARALFHLCKRRGFLSNRKTDGEDKENTDRKAAMGALELILQERGQTLGQYLHSRILDGRHVRFRGGETETNAAGDEVAIYPKRSMFEDEFNAIRKTQGSIHLSNAQWDELFSIFTYQRPLIPPKVGVCTFEHGRDGRDEAPRAWRHLPISHTFRIMQEANNLRYQNDKGDVALTAGQRTAVYNALEYNKSIGFAKIRTLLELPKSATFNLESKSRKNLAGNATAYDMRKMFASHEQNWDALTDDTQNDIVQQIHDAKDLTDFMATNREQGWNLPSELVRDLSNKYYPSAHGHLSRLCMEKLLPLMRDGMQYWEAACEVYGDHTDYSQFATGEIVEKLPYYGEVLRGATTPVRESEGTPEEEINYGKIPNPTVHVALNQLRKLVNTLVQRFGNPHEIHLELARNLKNAGKTYDELLKRLAKNTDKNEKRKQIIEENGYTPNGINLLKMRLWEELAEDDTDGGSPSMARIDVYTGRTIGLRQLFSDEIEVEHILPYGRTYDNSVANKTVTFREINRKKGGHMLPWDFAKADQDMDADAMLTRAKRLPRGKRWRFQSDAPDVYEQIITKNMTAEERRRFAADKSGAFIDRQLVDTQYISRIAARYLVPMVGEPARVVPVNGHVTNLIRNKWNINAIKGKGTDKERQDHRHHAEDALIVGLASRGLIKRIADESRVRQEQLQDYRAKVKFPDRPQWATDDRIKEAADRINVSFRQDHSREAKLYEETAYGILPKNDRWRKQGYNAVMRRPILLLKEKEISQIRDDAVREAIVDFLFSPEIKAFKKWDDKLARLANAELRIGSAPKKVRIRRVRIVVKNQSITPIPSANYKGYATDSIAFCDIWHEPKYDKKGTATGKWGFVGAFVSYADAKRFENDENQLNGKYRPHPAARKAMRLFKNDMVILTDGSGKEQLMRVAGYSTTNNRLDVRPHLESGGKQAFKGIPALMEKMCMQKIHVSEDGRIIR